MVSQEQIDQWKQVHEEIYSLPILGENYIYRILGREEYKEILDEDLELTQFHELVCQSAVLYPEDLSFDNGLAGTAETLCNAILESSGLHAGQAKEILDFHRDQMLVFDYQADCIIHEAFPEYRIEDIQNWSVKKIMYYLSRAEYILRDLKGVPMVALEEVMGGEQQEMQQVDPAQVQAYMQQMQQQQQPMISPQQRAEMSPLTNPEPIRERPQQPAAQENKGPLSQAEVEAMLSQSMGKSVDLNQETKLGAFPELAWFKAEEELKGEID